MKMLECYPFINLFPISIGSVILRTFPIISICKIYKTDNKGKVKK